MQPDIGVPERAGCVEGSESSDEFTRLIRGLTAHQLRLVWLFAEALGLEGKQRRHQCDRLRALERAFGLSLQSARRQARIGLVDLREIDALDEGFGVSRSWVLTGDVDALRAGIVAFGRGSGRKGNTGEDRRE